MATTGRTIMGGGFQFFDIIFLALVAAFIILRLRSVLGRRTGNERQRPDPFHPAPPQPAPPAQRAPEALAPAGGPLAAATPAAGSLAAGLAQIKVADPSFDEQKFINGARSAFEYIVTAFAAGDETKLKPLLSTEVFDRFTAEIRNRKAAGHVHETTIVRVRDCEIVAARMEGTTAAITVRYVSEQINVTRDAAGQVVEGDPDRIAEVTDVWTYARNTRSSDPNWVLVATDATY